MPNIFSNMVDYAVTRLGESIAGFLSGEKATQMKTQQEYYEGTQKRPLKLKPGQADDNVITNLIRLGVDRANSMLFGAGVEFTVPGGPESAEAKYLESIWMANKKSILLHRLGLDGEIFGTGYIKIMPDALPSPEGGEQVLPRLALQKPSLMCIETDPMDIERVLQYLFEVKIGDEVWREVTRRIGSDEVIEWGEKQVDSGWVVEMFVSRGRTSAWELINQTPWPLDFPPIIHVQNLPSIHSVYGLSSVGDVIGLQDDHNFIKSNIKKIIRYHSHPKTWGRGIPSNAGMEKVSWGADEMIKIASESGHIANLEMQSDLASSRSFAADLRKEIFDIMRVVDTETLRANAGNLTHFVLQAIYSDALSKNTTRRLLYGDMLQELNRRLLVMKGLDGANEVQWGPDLPSDEQTDARLILDDLTAGIVSLETASTKRGYQWKTSPDGLEIGEQDKIAGERANQGNAENEALLNFFAGRTVP
jgi:hypothetical protein